MIDRQPSDMVTGRGDEVDALYGAHLRYGVARSVLNLRGRARVLVRRLVVEERRKMLAYWSALEPLIDSYFAPLDRATGDELERRARLVYGPVAIALPDWRAMTYMGPI